MFDVKNGYSNIQKECISLYREKMKHCFDNISRDECFYEIHIEASDFDSNTIYALANLLTICNPPLIIVKVGAGNDIQRKTADSLYDKLQRMLVHVGCYTILHEDLRLRMFVFGQLNLGKLNLIPEDE
jgi:hypothetical protein